MRKRNVTRIALALMAMFAFSASLVPMAQAAIEVERFDGAIQGPDGSTVSEAGGHPNFTTEFEFAETLDPEAFGGRVPNQSLRDLEVELPPGLVGNPSVAQTCSYAGLAGPDTEGTFPECPVDSQVGLAEVDVAYTGFFPSPIYRVKPRAGVPAGFAMNVASALVFIDTKLVIDDEGNYAIRATSINTSQALPIVGAKLTFWGVPNDRANDPQRLKPVTTNEGGGSYEFGAEPVSQPAPFMSLSTTCTGTSPVVSWRARSWQQPNEWTTGSFPFHDGSTPPNPVVLDGCESLPFEPSVTVKPTSTEADSPTGLDVHLTLPQRENPTGPSTAAMKRIAVTLPEGMSVNASSVNGLGACTSAQIGMGSEAPVACPDSSKIGTVQIKTPLLEEPLGGAVYLAAQGDNPFHSLLSLYVVGESKERGVLIKLAGKVDPDPQTGRLVATFDDNPQLPFDSLDVNLKSGPRAPLINPPTCGGYTSTAQLSPWSAADPDNPMPAEIVTSTSSFQVTSGPGGGACPNGGFDPKLSAGTTNPLSGAYSPFELEVSRADGNQLLSTVSTSLPKGLLGKLAGIPYCPDAALASVPTAEGSGAGQVASPSCPAASRIGSVVVGAGAGSMPFRVDTGAAYLAGPYKGAPLSMAFVTPAIAGPFDLGNVVVRAALQVNPETAQITAVSDPLPTILHGIPLDLRSVRIAIDRDGFTLNPTSCDPMAVASTIAGVGGALASPSSRFQAASCERLAFQPKLALALKGATRRTGHPALKATVTFPGKGASANIRKAQVGLPHSLFLDQGNLGNVCKQADLKAGTCPKSSIYGKARAWTPLLDKPLEGPVYLGVGYGHKLPDLVADLDGQIRILLNGKVDTTKQKGLRNTFEAVPDAPVSKFTIELKGGKKYGLIENSENLCKKAQKASVQFTAQNGKALHLEPKIGLGCGKPKPKKKGAGK